MSIGRWVLEGLVRGGVLGALFGGTVVTVAISGDYPPVLAAYSAAIGALVGLAAGLVLGVTCAVVEQTTSSGRSPTWVAAVVIAGAGATIVAGALASGAAPWEPAFGIFALGPPLFGLLSLGVRPVTAPAGPESAHPSAAASAPAHGALTSISQWLVEGVVRGVVVGLAHALLTALVHGILSGRWDTVTGASVSGAIAGLIGGALLAPVCAVIDQMAGDRSPTRTAAIAIGFGGLVLVVVSGRLRFSPWDLLMGDVGLILTAFLSLVIVRPLRRGAPALEPDPHATSG